MSRKRQLSPKFDQAVRFASVTHRHQRRKGTDIPYMTHLLHVSSYVLEFGGKEDQAIAGLLHDTMEDWGVKKSELKKHFGTSVAQMVEDCSDYKGWGPKAPWRERKEKYLKSLSRKEPTSLLVTACDKLHNSQCIVRDLRYEGTVAWRRFKDRRPQDILWYYRSILKALKKQERRFPSAEKKNIKALFSELARTVEEMHLLAAVKEA